MATFTVTTPQNIDALTGKTGGDTYNINGGVLTIDQDSRFGLNQTTSTSLGALTISATLGGTVDIDARFVRIIPYNTGTGNVPASGTVISRGGASGVLIGVWSAVTAAPTAAAAAMPATGFIKIKQWNSVAYTAGALTGIGASATGADSAGWIEIVGDEAATQTLNRLGNYNIKGEWYQLGTTNGVANQTFQVPTSGLTRYIAGVFIEKSVGSNDYEFYAAAGSQTSVATDSRAKVVWCTTAGVVRLGHNGTANAGFTPVSGLKVVIGNIFLENCTTAARTANALPNTTLATRYDYTTTGAGVLNIDKCNMAWYLSCAQAYQVTLSNMGALESINVSEIATPMTWTKVGVGQTAAQSNFALVMALCFAGGTFTDCHWSRATLASSGNYTVSLTGINGFTFVNQTSTGLTVKGNATSGNYTITRAVNCTWTAPKLVNGRMVFVTCTNCTVTDTVYIDVITGTTAATAVQNSYVWEISTNCNTMMFSGCTFGGLTNVQAYLGLLNIAAAGCSNIKLRNIGTYASKLSLGSANQSAVILALATGAAASNVKVQRIYTSNTRTNIFTGDNSSTGIILENVFGDYADVPTFPILNGQFKGMGMTPTYAAQTAIYGTHFLDHHTSTTAGRIALMMNEKTTLTNSVYSITSGTPAFTSAGGLYMPVIGQQIEFTTPEWIIGHNSFQNAAPVMAGGTIGNYTLEFQIDKNNGAGYSAWATMNAANLSAVTGIDSTKGFKMKWRITTSTTNATAITSLYILTNSNTTSQAYQYPLDINNLTLTNIQTGSDVVIYEAGTQTILGSADLISGTTFTYTYSGADNIDIGIFKEGYIPLYVRNLSIGTTDSSLPIAQVIDRAYLV